MWILIIIKLVRSYDLRRVLFIDKTKNFSQALSGGDLSDISDIYVSVLSRSFNLKHKLLYIFVNYHEYIFAPSISEK